MQISSSLLGNMLDVVEEVQVARMELRNLIQGTFSSQSGKICPPTIGVFAADKFMSNLFVTLIQP